MTLELLGLLAGLLLLASSFPQLREALTEGAQGVSIGSWSLFLGSAAVWTAYGLHVGSAATIYANAGGVIAFGILVAALVRMRSGSSLLALLVPVGVAGVIGLALFAPTPFVGVLGVVLGVCLAVPQLVLSWRTRHAPSKVSVAAWSLVVSGQILWLTYGLLRPDAAIIVVNALSLLATCGVLALAVQGRSRATATTLALDTPASSDAYLTTTAGGHHGQL
ncbi:MAG: hypothetical protein ACH36H_07185 [Candidatus Nanopelagicales bacterium]